MEGNDSQCVFGPIVAFQSKNFAMVREHNALNVRFVHKDTWLQNNALDCTYSRHLRPMSLWLTPFSHPCREIVEA